MARDTLGNTIEENSLVMVSYNGQPTIAKVIQVKPGGIIGSASDRIPVAGMVVLQIIIPVMFQGDEVPGIWVLRNPSNQELAMAQTTSEKPS